MAGGSLTLRRPCLRLTARLCVAKEPMNLFDGHEKPRVDFRIGFV